MEASGGAHAVRLSGRLDLSDRLDFLDVLVTPSRIAVVRPRQSLAFTCICSCLDVSARGLLLSSFMAEVGCCFGISRGLALSLLGLVGLSCLSDLSYFWDVLVFPSRNCVVAFDVRSLFCLLVSALA